VSEHESPAFAIAAAITSACPELRPVGTPHLGAFATPMSSPETYPSSRSTRGYYVPNPPPAPFRLRPSKIPTLVGEHGGRQWTVQILIAETGPRPVAPTMQVRSYVRFVRSPEVPFPYLPWVVATAQPAASPTPNPFARTPINLVNIYSRTAAGEAALLLGRLPQVALRPPVAAPMILESGDPAIRSLLETPAFLQLYGQWERRAGPGTERGGPALPVLKGIADTLKLTTGLDLALDPGAHARTVAELLDTIPRMEFAVTGRDPVADPIPTLRFTDPPGSVPDVRPAYPCPRCGRPEILKYDFDRATGFAHRRTLGCGVDIFPPYPDRFRDAAGAGAAVTRH
jgi:hypothetical protein